MPVVFHGFPPEAMTFFRGLARHNDREWFQPRKPIYDQHVKAPMVEMVTALNREMMSFAPAYVTDPAKAIYRIYRDVRFSRDKVPYKTQIAASFYRRGTPKHNLAGYYFSVSPKGIEVGGGVYMPPPESLAAIRKHMSQHHEDFRSITQSRTMRKLFGEVQGEQLTRVPKGFPPDHPAADLLKMKQYLLYIVLEAEIATTPNLYREVLQRFRAMAPFIDFLNTPLARRRPQVPFPV